MAFIKKRLKPSEIDPTRFGTHVPMLRAVCDAIAPKMVVELGLGDYSTKEFLKVPSLKLLYSYETNSEWANKFVNTDPRFLCFVNKDIKELWKKINTLCNIDLIFIDCAGSQNRIPTYHEMESKAPVIIMHDYEVYYKSLTIKKNYLYVLKNRAPWTMCASDVELNLKYGELM
jgi:hypothetical protein